MEAMALVRTAAVLLAYVWFTVSLPGTAALALLMLVLAALGGACLNLGFYWKQVLLPNGIVVVHALITVVGFALLLVAAFR